MRKIRRFGRAVLMNPCGDCGMGNRLDWFIRILGCRFGYNRCSNRRCKTSFVNLLIEL